MKTFLFSFLYCLLISFNLSAQTNTNINQKYILNKLEELRFDTKISEAEKEKALFRLKSESEKIDYKLGVLISGRRIIEIYENHQKNKEIIKLATELKKIDAGEAASRTMANLYRSNALALGYLGLNEEGLKDFRTAAAFAKKIKDQDIKNYTLSLIYSNQNLYFINKKIENKTYKDSVIYYEKKSIEAASHIKNHEEISIEDKYSSIAYSNVRIGITYLAEANQPGNIQLAEKYLISSLDIVNKYNLIDANKVLLLNQLSWLYLEKKEYSKTIEYARQALNLEKKFPDPTNRVESFEFLASAYNEMGNTKNSKLYMNKYTILKDSIRITEKNNVGYSANILLSDSKKTQEKISSRKIIIISTISLLILVSVVFYWRRKNKLAHKKYEELIAKISNEQKELQAKSLKAEDHTEAKTSVSITDETAKALLARLEKFELSEKYLRKDISLTWMANHFNTNTKYLSEIIKTYRDKNFTTYINGLRIGYITKKLYENPIYREYKINYLAEECGYTTPQVFVTAFKKETGFTPSYFLEQLKVSV